jgi:flagellar hook-basal body complex protein FliE
VHVPQVSAAEPSGQVSESFGSMLQTAIGSVEKTTSAANNAVADFISGGPQELHSTILAVQNAELQFDMFLQARNKVVSAYEEIMRMQV